MREAIEAAIQTATEQGKTPVEIRLGSHPYGLLAAEESDLTGRSTRFWPPLVLVESPDHASLKVRGGPHIVIVVPEAARG